MEWSGDADPSRFNQAMPFFETNGMDISQSKDFLNQVDSDFLAELKGEAKKQLELGAKLEHPEDAQENLVAETIQGIFSEDEKKMEEES